MEEHAICGKHERCGREARAARRIQIHIVVAWAAFAILACVGCNRSILTDEPLLGTTERDRVCVIEPLQLPPERGDSGPHSSQPGLAPDSPSLDLRIEDVRSAALKHNLDLAVELFSPRVAQQIVNEEQAKFDAVFVVPFEYAHENLPVGDTVTRNDGVRIEPGIRVPLLTGGTATLGLPAGYERVALPGGTEVDTYEAGLRFSLSHPLLRGAGRYVTTAPLRVARLQSRKATARAKLEATYVLANAERAYWDVWGATQEVDIRREQFQWAEEQVVAAERLVRAGAAPDIEITRARAGVARRLQAIIAAELRRRLLERALKRVMNRPDLSVGGATILLPTTVPAPLPYDFDPATLARYGVSNRMEILELELELAIASVSVRVAQNAMLPSFALGFDYTFRGAGSTFRNALDGMVDDSLSDVRLTAGFEIPLGNRAARARLRRAVLTRAQTLSTRAALQQAIQQEVYDAWTQLEANWELLLAARNEVILSGRTFEGERRQFQARTRTSTDVLFALEFLADARVREARALAEFQRALVEMAFATGTTLGHSRIHWPSATRRP